MKKKIVSLIIVVVAFLAPTMLMAQTALNTTNKTVTLKALDKSVEVTILPHKEASLSAALILGGKVNCTLFAYEGMVEREIGILNKTFSNAKIQITADDLAGKKEVIEEKEKKQENNERKECSMVSNKEKKTTKVVLANKSDFRFVCLDGAFAGVALKPKQVTKESFSVGTGQLELTFKHDVDPDSIAHGRSYRQSVLSCIIATGQDTLYVTNEYLAAKTGSAIKLVAKSLIPFKFVFTDGPWKSKALRLKGATDRKDLYEGFNSFTIQFVGWDGLKYQADLEVIVAEGDKMLLLKEGDIKNKRIKQ